MVNRKKILGAPNKVLLTRNIKKILKICKCQTMLPMHSQTWAFNLRLCFFFFFFFSQHGEWITRQTHKGATTSLQRRCNVVTLQRRCNHVCLLGCFRGGQLFKTCFSYLLKMGFRKNFEVIKIVSHVKNVRNFTNASSPLNLCLFRKCRMNSSISIP